MLKMDSSSWRVFVTNFLFADTLGSFVENFQMISHLLQVTFPIVYGSQKSEKMKKCLLSELNLLSGRAGQA